jgi:hypothetical protein
MGDTMSGTVWKDEQIEILKREYGKLGPDDLAPIIGRSRKAIVTKANSLGLTLPPSLVRKGRQRGGHIGAGRRWAAYHVTAEAPPDELEIAKNRLRRRGWVVYGAGPEIVCGHLRLTPAQLIEKAAQI